MYVLSACRLAWAVVVGRPFIRLPWMLFCVVRREWYLLWLIICVDGVFSVVADWTTLFDPARKSFLL